MHGGHIKAISLNNKEDNHNPQLCQAACAHGLREKGDRNKRVLKNSKTFLTGIHLKCTDTNMWKPGEQAGGARTPYYNTGSNSYGRRACM